MSPSDYSETKNCEETAFNIGRRTYSMWHKKEHTDKVKKYITQFEAVSRTTAARYQSLPHDYILMVSMIETMNVITESFETEKSKLIKNIQSLSSDNKDKDSKLAQMSLFTLEESKKNDITPHNDSELSNEIIKILNLIDKAL